MQLLRRIDLANTLSWTMAILSRWQSGCCSDICIAPKGVCATNWWKTYPKHRIVARLLLAAISKFAVSRYKTGLITKTPDHIAIL